VNATEERLARLEDRLAKVEAAIERAETLFAAFAAGPGKKVLAMLGVKLP